MSTRPDLESLLRAGRTPNKFATLPLQETSRERSPGQVVVMFALMATALLGILGLAIDVGNVMAARHAVQGAADSGAIAGARQIVRYANGATTSALADVETVVEMNSFEGETIALRTCEYIGNNWGVVGNCSAAVPSSAAGTRIRTRVAVQTFFIRVLPGAPETVNVSGYAKARVEPADSAPIADQAPFIICGAAAWDVSANPTGTGTGVGANLNFLTSESPFRINPSHVGKTFRVMDPDLPNKGNAECSTPASSVFHGRANASANNGKGVGSDFSYQSGTAAPSNVVDQVKGPEGCTSNTGAPYGCVMLLPVADNVNRGNGMIKVLGFAAFRVTQVSGSRYNATLLDDYIVSAPAGSAAWCRDCGGAVVIRVIW